MSHRGTAQFTVAFILVLAWTMPLVAQIGIVSMVAAAGRTITLVGDSGGWNFTTNRNPMIMVSQGESISIAYSSADGAFHRFVIDVDGSGPRCSSPTVDKCDSGAVPPSRTFPLNVDFAAGNYTYYCIFHQGSMFGNFVVQGFRMSASPASLTAVQGFTNTSTVTVASVNNFGGTVNLAAVSSPSGPNPVPNPSAVSLSPGGTALSTLTVSTMASTPAGDYNITITGTSGSATNSLNVTLTVLPPDFAISANPKSLTIPRDSFKLSTITFTSVNNFSDNITVSTNAPAGITAMPNPVKVLLLPGGTVSSALNVTVDSSVAPSSYTITVTGDNGTISHSTTVTVLVVVPDFSLASSPMSLSIAEGSSANITVTVTSILGFSGTVTLTAVSFPSLPVVTPGNSAVPLSSNGTASVTLQVAIPTGAYLSTSPGFYSVNITGTSGTLSHSVSLSISASSKAPNGGIPTVLLIAAVVVPAAFLVTFYLARRRRTKLSATGTQP